MTYYIEQKSAKVPGFLSWRVMTCAHGFFACVLLYLIRISMSISIVCMVKSPQQNATSPTTSPTNSTDAHYDVISLAEPNGCTASGGNKPESSSGEFTWSRQTQGLILSSFFIGYVLTQILGGWLATRFGSRWIIFMSIFMTGLPSFFIPVAARRSPYLVLALRIVTGIGSGVFYPSFHSLFGKWAPSLERSKMVSMTYSGSPIGALVSFLLTGVLCKQLGWTASFYIYGLVCMPWLVFWFFFGHNSPAEHPCISEAEKCYIESSVGHSDKKPPPTPWFSILTSVRFWVICLSDVGNSWVTYTLLTGFPLYLKDVMKLNIQGNGLFSAMPPLANFLGSYVFSYIVDIILRKRILNTTVVRKIAVVTGNIPAAILLIATGYMNCHQRLGALAMVFVGEFTRGAQRSGTGAALIDIAPRFSGVIMGIGNTVSSLTGILTPIVTGYLTKDKSQANWQGVFYLSAIMAVVPTILFLLFGSGEEQSWAKVKDDKIPEEKEKEKVTLPPAGLTKGTYNPAFNMEGTEYYRKIAS